MAAASSGISAIIRDGPGAKAAKRQRGIMAFEDQQQQRNLAEAKTAEAEFFKDVNRMHRRNENFCTPEEQEGLIQRQIDESYRSVCSSPWSWKLWRKFAVRQQEQQDLAAVADPRTNSLFPMLFNRLQQPQQREQEREPELTKLSSMFS